MIFLILIFLMATAYYLSTYARWAWEHNYRRGAIGIIIIALITLVLPVTVWFYHQYVR